MKYIELLNGFKELENEINVAPIWTTNRKYRFSDLCSTMSNPKECNLITYGDIDSERSDFLSALEIDNLMCIRNRIANKYPDKYEFMAAGYFGLGQTPFKINFYRMVDDSCLSYVLDICKRKDILLMVSEFCNILAVASDVIFDWVDPNIEGFNREGSSLWKGRGNYLAIDTIYAQSNTSNVYTISLYNELLDELSWTLPWLNAEFLKESRVLKTMIEANKKWIDTLATRYLSDPRQRRGDLVKNCRYYDHAYTMLELIWDKLGYRDKFKRRYI